MIGQVIAFRGDEGRGWQSALIGVELRLGSGAQLPVTLTGGTVRQPVEQACIDACPANMPRFGGATHPTVGFAAGYLFRVGTHTEVGPEFTLTRTLANSERFHSVHFGLRLTRRL